VLDFMAPKQPGAVMVASGQTRHNNGDWRFYAYADGDKTCDELAHVADSAEGSAGGGAGGSCHFEAPVQAGGGKVSDDEWLYGGQAVPDTATVVATLTNGQKLTVGVYRFPQFPTVFFVVQPEPGLMVSDVAAFDASGRALGHRSVPVLPTG
jgi:hypothetical protein